jgi:hypothetical protein
MLMKDVNGLETHMPLPPEPHMVINGVCLNSAEAMAVRVAIQSFLMELSEPKHIKELGLIGLLYKENLGHVNSYMARKS